MSILPDIETMSALNVKDLVAHRSNVEKAIEMAQTREKAEILEEMEGLAARGGYSVEEILGKKKTPRKSSAKAKYAHPDDPSKTWTGNGKRPGWLVELLAQGRQKEDFLIKA